MKAGIGFNDLDNPGQSVKSVLEEALDSLNGKKPDLVILFTTERYDQEMVLDYTYDTVGQDVEIFGSCMAGCFRGTEVSDHGMVAAAIKLDNDSELTLFLERGLRKFPERIAANVSSKVKKTITDNLHNPLLLLLPDGVTGTLGKIVHSIYRDVGARVRFAGGGAGDNLKFLRSYQFTSNGVASNALAGALIVSRNPVGIGVAHGWKPESEPFIINNASGNVVNEMDWMPAFEVFSDFARTRYGTILTNDNFAGFAMMHPVGIPQVRGERSGHIIRDPIALAGGGGIRFVGEVPVNSVVRIMKGDTESINEAARLAAEESLMGLEGANPGFSMIFSCVSRFIMLGEDGFRKELDTIGRTLGPNIPFFGCLTFGEIGTLRGGPADFHNKSVVITTFPSQ